MNNRKNRPMTLEGKIKLQKELDHLIKVERETVKKALAEARALGDLSENAEYQTAKEKQSLVEGKIIDIQNSLNQCQVIDVSSISSEKIVFGATVTLYDYAKEKTSTYQIVGKEEANIDQGKISYAGPLGKALMGKEKDDIITVNAPAGEMEYKIQDFYFK